ncbi:SDR family NAD(P)-dependent oxidoreductase [Sorangium sp. So ce118]
MPGDGRHGAEAENERPQAGREGRDQRQRARRAPRDPGGGAPHGGDAGGRIINVSSIVARSPRPTGSVYSASKAAIEALTRCHAAELGRRGITVNAVAPGLVDTDMISPIVGLPAVQGRLKASALGRLGEPADIADAVAFLASDDARWVTGHILEVSGGAL